MKAYIVTSGSYSDYGIEKVFLDEKKAQEYCNFLIEFEVAWNGDAKVEEYEIDDDFNFEEKFYVEVSSYGYKKEINVKAYPEKIGRNYYSELYNELELYIRVKSKNAKKEEYIKIFQDKLAEINSLIKLEGYTEDMINEMLNKED